MAVSLLHSGQYFITAGTEVQTLFMKTRRTAKRCDHIVGPAKFCVLSRKTRRTELQIFGKSMPSLSLAKQLRMPCCRFSWKGSTFVVTLCCVCVHLSANLWNPCRIFFFQNCFSSWPFKHNSWCFIPFWVGLLLRNLSISLIYLSHIRLSGDKLLLTVAGVRRSPIQMSFLFMQLI